MLKSYFVTIIALFAFSSLAACGLKESERTDGRTEMAAQDACPTTATVSRDIEWQVKGMEFHSVACDKEHQYVSTFAFSLAFTFGGEDVELVEESGTLYAEHKTGERTSLGQVKGSTIEWAEGIAAEGIDKDEDTQELDHVAIWQH